MSARRYLPVVLIAVIVTSGCIQGLQHSDPVLINDEQRTGTLDVVEGRTSVSADVRNEGHLGNVMVTLEVMDEDGSVLEEYNRIVRMEENETRRVTVSAEVPPRSSLYRLSVASAD